ncbi:MAG: Nramp family divalent metal transporter [Saprospiraceae bacterium]|nr:Nramp family divalent metal transporter [Saprospiraceae bacterium]
MPQEVSKSLEEVHESVETNKKGLFRRLFAFMGPAYLVAVGYMDPGNWATDIAGGSQFGYTLIWVLLMSNLMALLLQSLSTRLGIVSGRDLAQASKETYSRSTNFVLYILAEVAIAATDLAEVLGMAIGLQLLFGIPLLWGVLITFFDTFILLFFIHRGMRVMEAFILALVGIIGLAFFAEMFFAKPDIQQLMTGFIPSMPNQAALYISIGIIGATVMPHNLYLHSSLVQSRKFGKGWDEVRSALRFNFVDSTIALNLAFFVNAAILVLAAATFYRAGMYNVSEIQDAHRFLEPLLGSRWASIFFAIALIAAGQSSTITGTLAGQVVMEGYLNLRIQPWIRRLITRTLAIGPAVIIIVVFGEGVTGKLLIFSQVVLSLQLGFAIIPLIHFVSDRRRMGKFAIGRVVKILSWITALVIVGLNAKLVLEEIITRIVQSPSPWILWVTIVPIALGAAVLLLYVTFAPFVKTFLEEPRSELHAEAGSLDLFTRKSFERIAVAIDFSDIDIQTLRYAISMGTPKTTYQLIHVVESAGALLLGDEIRDKETGDDASRLERYALEMREKGLAVETYLGFGNPKISIPKAVESFQAELLVLGAHGHRMIKDLIFGTTVDSVRHKLKIPVFIVREDS